MATCSPLCGGDGLLLVNSVVELTVSPFVSLVRFEQLPWDSERACLTPISCVILEPFWVDVC